MKIFNRHGIASILLTVILIVSLMCCTASASDGIACGETGPSDPAEVEAFFDEIVPAELARYNIPGATVAVVYEGEPVLVKGYGYSDVDNRSHVDPNLTLFNIGSITKLFTWTAVMQLVEEVTIDLDADINTYLKDFSIPDTYPGEPVTMRHLMTHSAGFEDQSIHAMVGDESEIYSYRTYCADNIPSRVYPPETVTSYSNYGTTLAAVIVEDVSGVPYEEYISRNILVPLGMNRTKIRRPLPVNLADELSDGYIYSGRMNEAVPDTVFIISPAGSIASTASDMAKFLTAHMQNGRYGNATILTDATAEMMHSRSFANDQRVSGMCLGFYEMKLNNELVIGHGGDTKTFHSQLAFLPERNAGFIISYNSPGGNLARNDLLVDFVDHYYPSPGQIVPEPETASEGKLKKYEGLYRFNRHNYRSFEYYFSRDQPVKVTADPEGILVIDGYPLSGEYVETEDGTFTRLDGEKTALGDLVFREDADGNVNYLCIMNLPFFAMERIPWYGTEIFEETLCYVSAAILLTVIIWPLTAIYRKVLKVPAAVEKAASICARWISGIAALLFVIFVTVLLPVVTAEDIIMTYLTEPEIPPMLLALMTVPAIASVLAFGSLLFTLMAWKDGYWNPVHRVHYTIITIALLTMTWWVNYWNLFVFRL